MATVKRSGERKTIILSDSLYEVLQEEIVRRGERTSFTSIVNEALAEKYASELKAKQLEKKAKLAK